MCPNCLRAIGDLQPTWELRRPDDDETLVVCSLSCLVSLLGLRVDAGGWVSA